MDKKHRMLSLPDYPTINDLWRWSWRSFQDLWLLPRFRDLLADSEYFAGKIQKVKARKPSPEQGMYARAAVILSVAAIEAASNDALASIKGLLGDQWPSGHVKDAPWKHFRGLSYDKVKRLLERGRLERKIQYVLARIERGTGSSPSGNFLARLRQSVLIRNRILHFRSLTQPKKVRSILDPNQIGHNANLAVETAREYLDLLEEGFEEMNLQIAAIKP